MLAGTLASQRISPSFISFANPYSQHLPSRAAALTSADTSCRKARISCAASKIDEKLQFLLDRIDSMFHNRNHNLLNLFYTTE